MQTTSQLPTLTPVKTNWPHVAWFLGLTFGLTWLVDLVLYLTGGLNNPATGLLLAFQMLLPAFSALFLGAFFFKESPIYYRTNRTASRWFVYFYFLLTFLYLLGSIAGLIQPGQAATFNSLLLIPSLLGLLLLIVLRLKGGKKGIAMMASWQSQQINFLMHQILREEVLNKNNRPGRYTIGVQTQ